MQRDILSATDEYSYQLFSPSSLSFMVDDVLKPPNVTILSCSES